MGPKEEEEEEEEEEQERSVEINTYPRRISRSLNLSHIFRGKKCVYRLGNTVSNILMLHTYVCSEFTSHSSDFGVF
jgi:hypothetical protein